MKMPKPTDADKERFRALVPDTDNVEVKPMFGNLGVFVNGNMFMGLFGADVGVRLAEANREALLAVDGAGPYGPAEWRMSGWVTLPPSWVLCHDPEADMWIGKALEQAAALPPKPKKKR